MMNLLVFFGFVFLSFIGFNEAELSPVVTTKSGRIQGQVIDWPAATQKVYQFLGIPFAEPPVGDLRFRKPVSKRPWANVFNAGKLANSCISFETASDAYTELDNEGVIEGTVQSEDCLILNIWVPKATLDAVANGKATRKLPVYVFIHGGGYVGGTTMMYMYNGTMISGYDNIIFVSIQYRVGPLGFAYFGNTPNATANAGLWDQLEALKWISENIGAFGGNSSEVTIGGESAGASSVTYHLLSPYSRPYFKRAIVESGSAIAMWALYTPQDATDVTNSLLSASGVQRQCRRVTEASSIAAKLQCLRSVGAKVLASETELAPVFDGDFVPRNPTEMLLNGDIYKVPLLIGFNHDEGSEDYIKSDEAVTMFESTRRLTYTDYEKLIKIGYSVLTDDSTPTPTFLQALLQQYRPAQEGHDQVMNAAIQSAGDFSLTCPTYIWANYTAKSANGPPVFAYHFTQKFLGDGMPAWMGSYHALELNYVFGEPFSFYANESGYITDEKLFSKALMEYWGNFIKTGNPGSVNVKYSGCKGSPANQTPVPRTWPAFATSCGSQILELNVETQVYSCRDAVSCNLKANDCLFWGKNVFFAS